MKPSGSGRPEFLFPLFAEPEALAGVGPSKAKALAALSVTRIRDLLFLLPHSVIERKPLDSLLNVKPPCVVTVEVQVGTHFPSRSKKGPYRIAVRDQHIEWSLLFFHLREDYLKTLLPKGERRLISGKVEWFENNFQMVHPDYILSPEKIDELPHFEPIYPLTAGLRQKHLCAAISGALSRSPEFDEWIDPVLKKKEGWPDWRQALEILHHPTNSGAALSSSLARQRLAYDELFAHQLTLALARAKQRRRKGVSSPGNGSLHSLVMEELPYQPTAAQSRAADEIIADMALPTKMNRLLQGDVGSGKTLVAFLALLCAVESGGQGVMMAPTEILARQHFQALSPLAALAGVRLELLTGRDRGKERTTKLSALERGEVDILLGTHAVFQRDVSFHDLRLAVIDEQHRFGVAQRMELGAKGAAVDILVMTATPIPRSLALACYGDMDISVLNEKPPGRCPVRTALISGDRMEEVLEHLACALREGRQTYWVCPLVEETEALDYSGAEQRYASLCATLGQDIVGLVHGQMALSEKDLAMERFVAGETRVLVATTVIEVGVDVPSASIIVIERADVFGLAQLHQLRGRVGRGTDASTCLLMYQAPLSESAARRLKIIRDTEDGFRIAEEDLAMRGAGDLIGTVQSGLPHFRVAEPDKHGSLMSLAQSDARALLAKDSDLTTQRGQAARVLLWLLEQDRAIRLLNVG